MCNEGYKNAVLIVYGISLATTIFYETLVLSLYSISDSISDTGKVEDNTTNKVSSCLYMFSEHPCYFGSKLANCIAHYGLKIPTYMITGLMCKLCVCSSLLQSEGGRKGRG